MLNLLRAIRLTLVLVVILGLAYPLAVTGVAQILFPFQANGSILDYGGHPVGSALIAQGITDPALFWPRPSAVKYAANGSGGSNLGPTNPALVTEVKNNLAALVPGTASTKVPLDMVESSASGLDPQISLPNANLQIPRVAKATGLSRAALGVLVKENTVEPVLGIWGDRAVNVLQLDLALKRELGKG